MFGVKFPGHGRPVQSYSFQIFGSGRFQFLDEFIQLVVHGSVLLFDARNTPTSARAAASKRSSAKTSESTTPPATSSTEATPAPRAPAIARPAHPPSSATAARTHESAEKKPKDEPQNREKNKNE